MTTTISELRELMISAGMDKQLVQGLDPSQPLIQQDVDSLDYPAFATAIEARFGIAINDDDSLRLKTLNDFKEYLNRK